MNVDIGPRITMLANKKTAEERAKARLKLGRKGPTPTNQRKPPAPPKKVTRRIQSRG